MTAMLVIWACLSGDCKLYEIPVETCAIGGQADMVTWRYAHPGYTVARWRCEPGAPA
jgi:hypothetical protein